MPHKDKEVRLAYYKEHNTKRKNHTKIYMRKRGLWVRHGITEEEYEVLLKGQDFSCALCKNHFSSFKRSLCVDHNHETGEIRGLLCPRCNYYIVGNKTIEELERALKYLRGSD